MSGPAGDRPLRADYRVVETIQDPTAPIDTIASFVIEGGHRGVQQSGSRP